MGQFTHTIKITELKKQKQIDSFSDVVVHCRWQLETTYSERPEHKETFTGATPFKVTAEQLQAGFTDFSDLTEADLISWVESNAWNLSDLKKKNEDRILELIEDPYVVVSNPWEHEDVPTGPAVVNSEENP